MDEIGQMEAEIEELRASLREKQAALEILGRAMGVIVPNARGTGSASEHAQMIADQAIARVAEIQRDRDAYRSIVMRAWDAFGQETMAVVRDELPGNPLLDDAVRFVISKTGGLRHPAFRR